MGQSHGKKSVDDKSEFKELSSATGGGYPESREGRSWGASVKLGVFTRQRKCPQKKTSCSTTPKNCSNDPTVEGTGAEEISNDSEPAREHTALSGAKKICEEREELPFPILPQEKNLEDGEGSNHSALTQKCGTEELGNIVEGSFPDTLKSSVGELDVGDLISSGSCESVNSGEASIGEDSSGLSFDTPIKWFKPFISNESSPSKVSNDSSYLNRDSVGARRTKWSLDHFRVATYHLWLTARRYLVDADPDSALKELQASEKAKLRFFDTTIHHASNHVENWSVEAERGDEDTLKALTMVIDATAVVLSCKQEQFYDAAHARQQPTSSGVKAALKGVEASVLAHLHSCLPSAVEAARKAVAMAPEYWRWHALLGNLLYQLPEAKDPRREMEKKTEMLDALESVCRLEPWNVTRLLYLGDAYRDVAFAVRKRPYLNKDFREYADKAVSTYMSVINHESLAVQSQVSAARSLWNLRRLRPDTAQKVHSIVGRIFRMLTDAEQSELDVEDDGRSTSELESQAESALALGLLCETMGQEERALCLFRMAATNPHAPANSAYRAELGLIVLNYKKGKFGKGKTDKKPSFDIIGHLDKLVAKFPHGDFLQQTLCHKGHYLMAVMKDNSAALDNFAKAASVKPGSQFLKKYYPRFGPEWSHTPLQISDLIHELACKELARVQVRASKGSPEAVRRAQLLEEQIQLSEDMNRADCEEGHDEGIIRTAHSSNESGDDHVPLAGMNPMVPKNSGGEIMNFRPDVKRESIDLRNDDSSVENTANGTCEKGEKESASVSCTSEDSDVLHEGGAASVTSNEEFDGTVIESNLEDGCALMFDPDFNMGVPQAKHDIESGAGDGGSGDTFNINDSLTLMFRETSV
ncbi:uncharacterized protein LOC124154055 [Ischnura elegans]|uniref:uncharacterized protein LOC124154055 n=1 Tax=Ischnura elegans TaxID=197161 RepID=UPI001ED8898A|nr:uncharacterized protein LOC124154055 [Ischnura elegans]